MNDQQLSVTVGNSVSAAETSHLTTTHERRSSNSTVSLQETQEKDTNESEFISSNPTPRLTLSLTPKVTVSVTPRSNLASSSKQLSSQTSIQIDTSSSNNSEKTKYKKMVACKFFFSERGCALGDACRFSHELSMADINPISNSSAPFNSGSAIAKESSQSDSNNPSGVVSSNSLSHLPEADKRNRSSLVNKKMDSRPACRFYASGFCKWGNRCGFLHARQVHKPVSSSKNALEEKLSELEDHQLKALRKTEITQLKKRFPKRVDVDEKSYRFIFKSSDPDWPFDVKAINLELCFPDLYPKHIMVAKIYEDDCLPPILSKHICKKMNDWLTDRHMTNQKADKTELVFRPFLRWLDKTMEQLFTTGLTMYKRELAAKAAGLTFVHHTELQVPAGEDNSGTIEATSPDTEVCASEMTAMEIKDTSSSARVEKSAAQLPSPPPSTGEQSAKKLDPARRGTELRLRNLRLLESAATLHCTILRIGIKCTRCKTVHHITMHSEKPYVVVCDRCRSQMSLVYHAALMHAASSTVGFFDLSACQPFDLVLQDCQLIAGCLECNKELPVHGLHADQEKQFWCISCHKKMIISVEKGTFILLNDGAAIRIGADAVLISKKAKAKTDLRIIAEGKPLPDKGACLHYKKSFRWFRFPCCGKLYPCDKCHDEKETDHEMELANRMICGFCSKEQGFSLTRPCVSCDSSLTRSKSQHWEGGQGCRNKLAMAKGDKQKFSGSNKTVSKRAESLAKKSAKKS